MKVTYLQKNEDPNFFDLLKNGPTHYVSIAMPGLTFASGLVDYTLSGFSSLSASVVERRYGLMSQINHAGETGTLYPQGNITLMPSPSEVDRFGMNATHFVDAGYAESEVLCHLEDAFLANREYVKSQSMYFDFRYLCVSVAYYNRCLEKKLETIVDEFLVHVYAWEVDPEWEDRLLK